jgi:phytoene dehydrogenase-like protein
VADLTRRGVNVEVRDPDGSWRRLRDAHRTCGACGGDGTDHGDGPSPPRPGEPCWFCGGAGTVVEPLWSGLDPFEQPPRRGLPADAAPETAALARARLEQRQRHLEEMRGYARRFRTTPPKAEVYLSWLTLRELLELDPSDAGTMSFREFVRDELAPLAAPDDLRVVFVHERE